MTIVLQVPAGERAVLLITFSASGYCVRSPIVAYSDRCQVAVNVDGAAASPGVIAFLTSEEAPAQIGAHSFQFAANVGAGRHVVTARYSLYTANASSTFDLRERSLTVLRSKVV